MFNGEARRLSDCQHHRAWRPSDAGAGTDRVGSTLDQPRINSVSLLLILIMFFARPRAQKEPPAPWARFEPEGVGFSRTVFERSRVGNEAPKNPVQSTNCIG